MLNLMEKEKLLKRITINPEQCGGRPCIRNMRIRVSDVIDMLSEGMLPTEIIDDFPYLELEDIKASLLYVSRYINHTVIAA
ncbi:MAG TPA: DUF433 domain-containing protein [Leptospiraceae bacterium]|nr:DUF433 domain-containing protein [Leptospiraceae bacterium]HNC00182.1 DUF433 domain-containing protein [Leptospiraceae bacterium]HNE09352.1 DUF433 domain-containing protein [Leptospiraceae bacterium]HNK57929.1 DUF433 domain-containing protein [Leptospiraceae bacterium]HNK93951.1 DUF433 domain-containing protein [Leptospiraceae bacterium]